MFHYLYYSVAIDESKEKFRIVFGCFSAIKNILVPSFSFKFVQEYLYLFVLIDLYQLVYNNFDDMKNLINFLLCSHHFSTFR